MARGGDRAGKRARTRRIAVDYLSRTEGEGSVYVVLEDGRATDVRFSIFEPPRLFEALLRGRRFDEPPDITSRICGICPIAYQMSACRAIENACGVRVSGPLRDLRRLIYCGEWIESHALHIYMLHAPDFLGYESGIDMARDHPEAVRSGLALKKAGNELMALVGGREIHPINLRVGGFYSTPAPRDLRPARDKLARARDLALETVAWVSRLEIPEYERDYEFVALTHPSEYPIDDGDIASSRGPSIPVSAYSDHFVERQVRHSTALQGETAAGGAYLAGPMARYALASDKLGPTAAQAAREAGLEPVCRNPFRSIVVRAVEVVQACDEAVRLIDGYRRPDRPAVPVEPREGTGYGATEAPRGLLHHTYERASIVPPTSQNQRSIELDLARVVEDGASLPDAELTWRCEQTVRNYDPCISCATHFLDLRVERT